MLSPVQRINWPVDVEIKPCFHVELFNRMVFFRPNAIVKYDFSSSLFFGHI